MKTEIILNVSRLVKNNIKITIDRIADSVIIEDNFSDDSIIVSQEDHSLIDDANNLYNSNGEITFEDALYFKFSKYSEVFC